MLAHSFILGLAAGLGVAIPLGAIGILVILDAINLGARTAVGAAAGIAVVDVTYCAAAILAGAAAGPAIAHLGPWPRVVGAGVLLAIALRHLVGVVWPSSAPTGRSGPITGVGGPLARCAVYIGLTAVNPVTLLYFAAVVIPLSGIVTGSAAITFVIGVGTGSFAWHILLVVVGATLGNRVTDRARRVTIAAGNVIVGALGVALLVSAIT